MKKTSSPRKYTKKQKAILAGSTVGYGASFGGINHVLNDDLRRLAKYQNNPKALQKINRKTALVAALGMPLGYITAKGYIDKKTNPVKVFKKGFSNIGKAIKRKLKGKSREKD